MLELYCICQDASVSIPGREGVTVSLSEALSSGGGIGCVVTLSRANMASGLMCAHLAEPRPVLLQAHDEGVPI